MAAIFILMAPGFEEVEAVTSADVLIRAGFEVLLASVTDDLLVVGGHGIELKCNCFIKDLNADEGLMVLLPGGMPGTHNLLESTKVKQMVREFAEAGKWLAAICAAPMILGEMGLLNGKNATCYPGYEKYLEGAVVQELPVVTDGKIITGRGIGAAMEFALEIVNQLSGAKQSGALRKKMVVEG